jgi:hypothetical protein
VGAAPTQAQQAYPYRFRTEWDVAFTAGGLAMFATDAVITKKVEPLTPLQIQALDRSQVNSFDRVATRLYSRDARTVSDVLLFTMLAAPVALITSSPGNQEPLLIGAMYGEALLFQSGLTFMLKSLVTRTRPFVYNDDPTIRPEEAIIARRSSLPPTRRPHSRRRSSSVGLPRLNPNSSAQP